MRERWPGQYGDLRAGAGLGRGMMQQGAAALLDALRTEDQRLVAPRRGLKDRAHMLSRRDYEPCIALGQVRKLAGRPDGFVEPMSRQEGLVLVLGVDGLHHLGFARPQQDFASAACADLRQSGAPGTAADDPQPFEAHAFTPAPRTFSASGSSGQRARAGASSASVSPCVKRSAPAQAIIAALSVHSQAGGTLNWRPSRAASCCSAVLTARFAATPPATTSAGASLR